MSKPKPANNAKKPKARPAAKGGVTPSQQKTLERLARVMKDIPPERAAMILHKNKTITIRVSEADKDEMSRAAQSLGLTLTDYLLRLHELATVAMARKSGGD